MLARLDKNSSDLFHDEREAVAWIICFLGTAGVSLGSAYYHWKPNNKRLVWDRLPMTVSFMTIQFILFCETVGVGFAIDSAPNLLASLILCGFSSVVYWSVFNDLTFYKAVQFVPQLLCPFLLIAFQPRYTMSEYVCRAKPAERASRVNEKTRSDATSIIATLRSLRRTKRRVLLLPRERSDEFCCFLLLKLTLCINNNRYYVYGLMWYAMAKVTENKDKVIYKLTKETISGHTLKHLCAAMALYTFYYQLVNREKL